MSTTSLTVTRADGVVMTDLNSNTTNSTDIAELTAKVADLTTNVTILKVMVPSVVTGIQQLQSAVSNLQTDVLALQNVPEPNVTVDIVGGEVTVLEHSTTTTTTLVSKAALDSLAATISS